MSKEESQLAGWKSYSCGNEHVRRRRPTTPTGTSPERSTPDQVYPYGCSNLGSRPISVNTILWRQQMTHDWLGERAILAGQNKDVEERNNIIQSNIQSEAVTGKGHSNAWPGTASIYIYNKILEYEIIYVRRYLPTYWICCHYFHGIRTNLVLQEV
jgi:hypothetical protein